MAGAMARWARSLATPLTVRRWTGPTARHGINATVLVAGLGPGLYDPLAPLLGAGGVRDDLGTVRLWELPRWIDQHQGEADLTILRLDRLSQRMLGDEPCLALPEWIELVLTLPEDLHSLRKGRFKRDIENDLRIVRREGYGYHISHDPEDIGLFHERFHVPYMSQRHADRAFTHTLSGLSRSFRHGGLLWVLHQGQQVAGDLFEVHAGELRTVALGLLDGDFAWAKRGAVVASYWFVVQHAKELGCQQVNFGVSRPVLTDGVMHYKRKWGPGIVQRRDTWYDYVVSWPRLSPVVREFLEAVAPVFRSGGNLSAITALPEGEALSEAAVANARRLLWTEGLAHLYILSDAELPPSTPLAGDCIALPASAAERPNPASWSIAAAAQQRRELDDGR